MLSEGGAGAQLGDRRLQEGLHVPDVIQLDHGQESRDFIEFTSWSAPQEES